MRTSKISNGLKVQVIAGTYIVLFGFNLPRKSCRNLLGFSIHRTDRTENEAYYLLGMKTFKQTDPGLPAGSLYSTKEHPVQSFQWADYSAKPGHKYTYKISALKGKPEALVPYAVTKVNVETECAESGDHDIYFNRGIAASQEYVRRFGDKKPKEVENNKAYEWLSRGLYEGLEMFVASCKPNKHQLLIAAYEFTYDKFLQLIKDTSNRGVDIKIIYDARKKIPGDENNKKRDFYSLNNICKGRTKSKSYISHNKFIVKLEDGIPISVWTGGTNFSEGGIYGHSNVAHVAENKNIAKLYYDYWQELYADPEIKAIKNRVEQISPLPPLPLKKGCSVVFSPRKSIDALKFYSDLALEAKSGLLMTFAFGMNDVFKNVYKNSKAPFRLALLEKKTRSMKAGPQRDAEEQKIQQLRNLPQNVFAVGNFIPNNKFEGWVKESLSGLNKNVKFIHNKFMLIDPLGRKPIVVSGSANFSEASVIKNDENMIILCGDKRVADIYLGEFMCLFSHYSFRESLNWRKPDEPPKPLRTDDWWKDYFGNTDRAARRKFFAKVDE